DYLRRWASPKTMLWHNPFQSEKSKPVAETAEHVVIGSAVCQSEEGVHINGRIRSDLVYQTCVECADPGSRSKRVIQVNIDTKITDKRARKADWLIPLHTHPATARFVQNVEPRLGEQR